ncbi:hypothetical protein, partial [Kitasatospora sp. NPDC059803]|uniref:hypothetical protein n=1 Tax=Kitasatospora sp. NPDC059803 TaxID=3346953 RepID=UPI00365638FD
GGRARARRAPPAGARPPPPPPALRIFHEVLPDLRRTLGPDHPEVRANEALLARWRRRADRRLRSEILFGRGHRSTDRRGFGKWSDG